MENMIDTQNKQQVMAFELIANTNSSFFLTGRAGTGKTTFLRNVQKMVDTVVAELGGLDFCHANAGICINAPADEMTYQQWLKVISVNLNSVFLTDTIAGKYMLAHGGGSIINTASMSGHIVNVPQPQCAYNASKAALNHLTRFLAIDLGDYGIRVNAIAPGPTHSDLDKDLPPSALAAIENGMPMHRFGMPIEIGALCVFLASPAAVQMTGNVIEHDGGMHLIG